MRAQPTDEEIGHYREHGFVVIEGLLDADELEDWRAVVTRAAEDRSERFPGPTNLDIPAELLTPEVEKAMAYYHQTFTQKVNLWQTDEDVRRLMFDPRLGELAARLAGVGGIRIWHDQALFKPPWGNPTSFHLDVPYWSFTSEHALSIWVALDDATLENGCLHFVPGSHLAQRFDNTVIGPELGALFDVYPEWRDVQPVPCPIRAGSATFHNGLTAHGAGANLTPRWRRAMTCAYMPDGSTYNGQPNILPTEKAARLSVGDPLDDEAQNPLVWSVSASAG